MQRSIFPWSDNWWIEENKAWFCGGGVGALFCVDISKQHCEMVKKIPECDFINFRLFPYCLKYKGTLFCIPSYGKCIWCYDIKEESWQKIEICSEYQIPIILWRIKKNSSRYFLQDQLGQFFEIDLDKKEVNNVYCLPQDDDAMFGGYVLVENNIYCVIANKIYCINLYSADIVKYEISEARAGFYTIVYDGNNFWISGFYKEIYVWNPKQGVVKIITEFPEQFGIYRFDNDGNFLIDYNVALSITPDACENVMAICWFVEEYAFFSDSIVVGKYIWFMPHRSNGIIYIDKETYQVFFMEIEEEKETKESIGENFIYSKYLIEYVREERYLGIYSVKNRRIFEIDTIELCVKYINYVLNSSAALEIAKVKLGYNNKIILREKYELERGLFSARLEADTEKEENDTRDIGKHIYHILDKQ